MTQITDELVEAFAAIREQHLIRIKPENRQDNLSSFICACGAQFLAGQRTDNDIDRHLAQAYADAGWFTALPVDEPVRAVPDEVRR